MTSAYCPGWRNTLNAPTAEKTSKTQKNDDWLLFYDVLNKLYLRQLSDYVKLIYNKFRTYNRFLNKQIEH